MSGDVVTDEDLIDALRLKAFRTNDPSDRQVYFDATSKWFQDRHYRDTSQAAEIERLKKEQGAVLDHDWVARTAFETAIGEAYGLRTRAETAERLLAEARAALGDVLDTVSDTLSCGRHCIIEAEAKDEADYAAVIASARATLTNGGENGR